MRQYFYMILKNPLNSCEPVQYLRQSVTLLFDILLFNTLDIRYFVIRYFRYSILCYSILCYFYTLGDSVLCCSAICLFWRFVVRRFVIRCIFFGTLPVYLFLLFSPKTMRRITTGRSTTRRSTVTIILQYASLLRVARNNHVAVLDLLIPCSN